MNVRTPKIFTKDEINALCIFSEFRLMRRHNNIANNSTKDGVRPAVTSEHCTSAKSKDVLRTGTVGSHIWQVTHC